MLLGLILSFLSIGYILYIYTLYFSREEKEYQPYSKPCSVIVPCYNEGYKELKECINSILKADGEKQIILVDNNSNKPETLKAINELRKNTKILLLWETRQGKRFAHSCGLKHAKYEIIVFVDSDTIIIKNALIELIKPFQDEKIGAVAGQVKVANRSENYLTKSLSAMFWTSNNIFRKASSTIGYMGVIAGALGAYRKKLLLSLEKDYLTQKFFGRPCLISDDRFLTMRIQTRFKKRIEYAPFARGYTYMPTTISKAWKMIERWKRGVIRETFVLWKEPFWNAKLLMFDVQFNFFIIFAMVILKLVFLTNLVLHFSLINLLYTLMWFIITATLYSTIMLIENTKEFPYKLLWSFLYEFLFVFTFIHALINIRNQGKWGTR